MGRHYKTPDDNKSPRVLGRINNDLYIDFKVRCILENVKMCDVLHDIIYEYMKDYKRSDDKTHLFSKTYKPEDKPPQRSPFSSQMHYKKD